MFVRIKIIRAVGSDDVLMILGTIFTFGLSIASMAAAYYGAGKHRIMFVKLSLLWFYLRLDRHGYMKWAVYVLTFVVLGLSIASGLVLAFSCFPPAKFWDLTGTVPGHCMSPTSQQTFYEANGVLNIVTDILIYLTPVPMLWKVQMPLRKKLALMGVFGVGILALAAGCVRYAYVKLLAGTKDQYYELADSLNWCGIEIYLLLTNVIILAICCGSAPSFSVLIKTYAPRLFGSYYGGQRYQSYSHSHGDQPLPFVADRSNHGWSVHGRDETTIRTGSQDAIVPNGGIMMKTDFHSEVGPSDPGENHMRRNKYDGGF
ncbi:hypothetical protein N7463_002384 [Penicillium fimorum]|uniref:Rhodopsin domain-containing protein n=1 Tax=Penicillium fimorum TaxID=1882269 RepID=A0A9W9XZ29_9EURO|nr:hypothetical protein N7463_002384 [Penicillium fimorum]